MQFRRREKQSQKTDKIWRISEQQNNDVLDLVSDLEEENEGNSVGTLLTLVNPPRSYLLFIASYSGKLCFLFYKKYVGKY